jgi:hypothetical protein
MCFTVFERWNKLFFETEEVFFFLRRWDGGFFFLEAETEEVHGRSLDYKLKFTPPDLELEANVTQTGPYVCF